MKVRVISAVLALALSAPLVAGERDDQEGAERQGEDARKGSVDEWLELQRSGKAAGSRPTLTGEEMQRIYDRYLDSFTHPIPETFRTEDQR